MDYKSEIIGLIERIEREDMLLFFYAFIGGVLEKYGTGK